MTPPGGIHADPEKLFQLAGQVLGDPWQRMARAHQTASTDCTLPFYAFGILSGAVMSSGYSSAQSAMAGSIGQAADLIHSMATSLADVAQNYGSAEQASSLVAPPTTLPDTGIAGDPGTGGLIAQNVIVGTGVALFVTFAAIHGVTEACSALTPAALVSVLAWELTEPNDGQLSTALSAWQSAQLDVAFSKDALDDVVSRLDDGWAREDSARPAFDHWWLLFDADLDQLKDSVGQFPDKLQDAIQEIHTIHTTLMVAAVVALGAIIALVSLDWIGGEAAQAVVAMGLNAAVLTSLTAIAGVVVTLLGYLIDLANKASGFSVTTPGSHALPRFDQVAIDWDPLQP